MTIEEAEIHNRAIGLAIKAYPKGIGAIKALKIKHVVVCEHIGTTTKQEAVDIDTRN